MPLKLNILIYEKGILNLKTIVERWLYPSEKMVESRLEDALIKLVKPVKMYMWRLSSQRDFC